MTTESFCEELIIAGFGGQGAILLGKLLGQAAMECGHEVTYMPSYGPEVRGGTANCTVIVSDELIACPLVQEIDTLIALNSASFNKFLPRIRAGGLLVMNSSLIDAQVDRSDIDVLAVPADDIALEITSPKSANMVALGAYLERRGLISPDAAVNALSNVLAKRHHKTLPANKEAIYRGAECAKAGVTS